MAYGFKLAGIIIPDGTTAINTVISDGTTPVEYTLTGSVADGFSGTGISATYSGTYSGEPTDIYNDMVTITADMDYNNPIPLSLISQDVITDINTDLETKLAGVSVTINGHAAPATPDGDVWRYVIEEAQGGAIIKAAFVSASWDRDTNEITGFDFTTLDSTYPESVIPGNYAVEIKYPAFVSELDITVDALVLEDVGDSYNVNVYTTEVTQSFKTAVEMVLEESGGGSGLLVVHITYNSDESAYKSDTSYTDIIAAYDAGKAVFANYDGITVPLAAIERHE